MLRLIPLILILAALPAWAAEPAAHPESAPEKREAAADPAAKPERRSNAECGQTGTRIKGGNRTQPMRCHSRDHLAKTGATDLGDALRRLDPTIR
jgi:hypothetical protein